LAKPRGWRVLIGIQGFVLKLLTQFKMARISLNINSYWLAGYELINDFASISPRIFIQLWPSIAVPVVACNAKASWTIIYRLALPAGLPSWAEIAASFPTY
jgi:hypothetical protein